MYQEPIPSEIPPGFFSGEPPRYDPYGPVGQLRDLSSEGQVTIGQRELLGYRPEFGWTAVTEGNYAYPALGIPGQFPGQPPPGAIVAMLAQQSSTLDQQAKSLPLYTVPYQDIAVKQRAVRWKDSELSTLKHMQEEIMRSMDSLTSQREVKVNTGSYVTGEEQADQQKLDALQIALDEVVELRGIASSEKADMQEVMKRRCAIQSAVGDIVYRYIPDKAQQSHHAERSTAIPPAKTPEAAVQPHYTDPAIMIAILLLLVPMVVAVVMLFNMLFNML